MSPSREVQAQSPEVVAAALEAFLAESPGAVVLEDGKLLFEMRTAKYALSTEHERCVLHLWSEERNLVRRVVGAELRSGAGGARALRLSVLRFGHAKPTLLEVAADRDRRTPSNREQTRVRYVKVLERALGRQFPEWKADAFRTAMDLEKSFGPAYARGLLVRGQRAWAVIGVNEDETLVTIDGVLTFGILWLQACRDAASKRVVVGLKVVLPRGMATLTLARMAWVRGAREEWELWELDQRTEEMEQRDAEDQGNVSTRLVQAPNVERAKERFAASAARVLAVVPDAARGVVEQRLRSGFELAFLLHGLEFARVRVRAAKESFNRVEEITFGAGANETPLNEENETALRELVARLCERRVATGDKRDPLYRMQPERWLEGELRRDLTRLDTRLAGGPVYAQVPAFAGGDRGMLDLLSATEEGRLAVIEVKAEEDPQLALQGLDYWARVRWHHAQNPDAATGLGEFQRHGYFGGVRLSGLAPRLWLVAPALRVHPATEVVLRYLSPEVEWTLAAIDERWRTGIRVIWRKRSAEPPPP
jgi:molybdopterin converting factor small subunit